MTIEERAAIDAAALAAKIKAMEVRAELTVATYLKENAKAFVGSFLLCVVGFAAFWITRR